jgi:hypothetical protein
MSQNVEHNDASNDPEEICREVEELHRRWGLTCVRLRPSAIKELQHLLDDLGDDDERAISKRR